MEGKPGEGWNLSLSAMKWDFHLITESIISCFSYPSVSEGLLLYNLKMCIIEYVTKEMEKRAITEWISACICSCDLVRQSLT